MAPYQSPTYRAVVLAPIESPKEVTLLHTMGDVRREMLAVGIRPEMLARVIDDKDDGEPLDDEEDRG